MAGPHTLAETERIAHERVAGLNLDVRSMAVASNLFRAATALRNHMVTTVLAKEDLTWTAFVVMWVIWIWESAETRMVAEEAGVSKATLSGVLNTLEGRGLVRRERAPDDGRLVLVTLTPAGGRMIRRLFPKINRAEQEATSLLSEREQEVAAEFLRKVVLATDPVRRGE